MAPSDASQAAGSSSESSSATSTSSKSSDLRSRPASNASRTAIREARVSPLSYSEFATSGAASGWEAANDATSVEEHSRRKKPFLAFRHGIDPTPSARAIDSHRDNRSPSERERLQKSRGRAATKPRISIELSSG